MKNLLHRRLWLLSATFGVLLVHGTALAHSGCCSSHGGVVGCGCGDGSPLSATCAPYYPECSNGGSTNQTPSYSTPSYTTQPSCPTGQHFDVNSNECSCPSGMSVMAGGSCGCNAGYTLAPSATYCMRLPAHAHGDQSNSDGWQCDTGYLKQGSSCTKVMSSSSSSSVSSVKPVTVTPKNNTKCHVNGALPDTSCTPGAVFQDATKDKICISGYTKKVRNVSVSLKNKIYSAYGVIKHTAATYEMDHLIPLELGGNNDITNLFPEAANPKPGFHEKDKLENYLHKQVCNGAMTLQEAQAEIATDWLKTYNTIFSISSH